MSEFDIAKIRELDGGLLLIFKELVETGNARETAGRLGLSPSAISHSLRRLRELFDDPLFTRKPHGLEPTFRARELHHGVKALLTQAEQLLDVSRSFDPATAQRVFVLAAPEYVTAQVAAPLVQRWKRRAPSVSLFYRPVPPEEAIRELRRGEVDIAVGRFDDALPSGLAREQIYQDVFCVAARRRHPRINGALSLEQYEAERHVLAASFSEITRAESGSIPKMPSGVGVENWTMALTIASETDSLATCHRRLAQRLAGVLRLQVLDLPYRPDRFEVSAVRREEDDPGVAWLRAELAEVLGTCP